MKEKNSISGPFAGKLLVTDMDGTLLNGKRLVSTENSRALERFIKGGGLFTVATGRMDMTVKPYLKNLPVNVPGIIFNGSAIYDFAQERVLWYDCLPDSIMELSVKILERFPGIGFQVFHGSKVYIARENAETEKHSRREGFVPVVSALDSIPKPWYKIILAWEPENLAPVEAWLKDTGGEFHAVYSEPQFLELLKPGVTKGHALKRLVALLGLPELKVIAMGDNMNDIELLREADTGIATENAHEAVKAAARICCCSNDSHAVAEVIGWMENGEI
jgi:Cof subfamily protein (haloacid dehalogenase superfamily)